MLKFKALIAKALIAKALIATALIAKATIGKGLVIITATYVYCIELFAVVKTCFLKNPQAQRHATFLASIFQISENIIF